MGLACYGITRRRPGDLRYALAARCRRDEGARRAFGAIGKLFARKDEKSSFPRCASCYKLPAMDTFISIGKIILTILEVIILFNLMIVVHELGHFWAARWRGLKVERFQIWFGKPIWKKKINGVQWGLGWLPFGGFVALPQMAPMETIEGGEKDIEGSEKETREVLPDVTPLDKIIVAVAGPIFSVLLAVVLAVIVWQVGTPSYAREKTTIIGGVDREWVGAEFINVGDQILKVNDVQVNAWFGANNSVTSEVAFSEGPTVDLTLRSPDGVERIVTVPVAEREDVGITERGMVRNLPIGAAATAIVGGVLPDSPADRAGLQTKDVIKSIEETPIQFNYQVSDFVEAHDGEPMEMVVAREVDGTVKELNITVTPLRPIAGEGLKPEDVPDRPMLGIGWGIGEKVIEYPTVGHQIKDSALAIFRMLGALFSSKSDIGVKDMSGPLMIGNAFYVMFADDGWQKALWFAVLINVNLAILNMMPLPVLDGGHIVLAIGEWIRKKPVSGRFLEVVQTAFALALLSLMAYVTILDGRSMFGGGGGGGGELKFPPVSEVRSTE